MNYIYNTIYNCPDCKRDLTFNMSTHEFECRVHGIYTITEALKDFEMSPEEKAIQLKSLARGCTKMSTVDANDRREAFERRCTRSSKIKKLIHNLQINTSRYCNNEIMLSAVANAITELREIHSDILTEEEIIAKFLVKSVSKNYNVPKR